MAMLVDDTGIVGHVTQDEAAESLMTARDRAIAWLARHDFEEQSVKGFWLHKDTIVAVDLNKTSDEFPGLPRIGRFEINGTITETGHGLSRVDDVRKGLEGVLKPKGAGQKNGKKEMPAPKLETKPEPKEAEVINETLPVKREKKELVVGTCEAVAVQYGIPTELANLFFMKMNEGLYIKNPGLLYLAGKKGYSRIEITDKYDTTTQEWTAECRIYPKISKELLEGIAKLDKEMQKQAFDFMTSPTNGTGRASKNNVKMSTMQAFLREMAQTRAQNRALRAFTGYGGTSVEELPEGQVEVS